MDHIDWAAVAIAPSNHLPWIARSGNVVLILLLPNMLRHTSVTEQADSNTSPRTSHFLLRRAKRAQIDFTLAYWNE